MGKVILPGGGGGLSLFDGMPAKVEAVKPYFSTTSGNSSTIYIDFDYEKYLPVSISGENVNTNFIQFYVAAFTGTDTEDNRNCDEYVEALFSLRILKFDSQGTYSFEVKGLSTEVSTGNRLTYSNGLPESTSTRYASGSYSEADKRISFNCFRFSVDVSTTKLTGFLFCKE